MSDKNGTVKVAR